LYPPHGMKVHPKSSAIKDVAGNSDILLYAGKL